MDFPRTFTLLDLVIAAAAGAMLAFALVWMLFQANRSKARNTSDDHELAAPSHELAQRHARFEAALQSADVHVWEHNLTTGRRWSSATPDRTDEDNRRSFTDWIHPDDQRASDALGELQPGETREQQVRLATNDADDRWVLLRSQAILRDGEHVIVGANIDITRQRKRTDVLVDLNNELTTRNRALRDFAHVASHDLRSPLRALSTLVEFLREDLPADRSAEVSRHLMRIDQSVGRMNQLIDDLLVYASAHNSESRLQLVAVSQLIQEALDTVENPNNVVTVIDGDLPAVLLAKTPFAMCLRNLIDNALKHHDKADGVVTISTRLEEGDICVAVADNGPGIDAKNLEAIFEPFRRLRAEEQAPGTGIGLSVIKRATAAHGAIVDVESVVGEGSTFTIRWPATPEKLMKSNTPLEQSALS